MVKNNNKKMWRQVHRWSGLGLAAFVIFYALTGLLLNHRQAFGYFTTRQTTILEVASLETAPLKAVLDQCKAQIDRADDPRIIRIPDGDTIEFLYGSHGKTTYRIKAGSGLMERVDKKKMEPFSWLNNRHKVVSTSTFWLVCADLVCVLALVLTISGLVVLRYRRSDFMFLGGGLLLLFLGLGLS